MTTRDLKRLSSLMRNTRSCPRLRHMLLDLLLETRRDVKLNMSRYVWHRTDLLAAKGRLRMRPAVGGAVSTDRTPTSWLCVERTRTEDRADHHRVGAEGEYRALKPEFDRRRSDWGMQKTGNPIDGGFQPSIV